MASLLSTTAFFFFVCVCSSLEVSIRNDVPRLDVNGQVIDCHSGNIIRVGGVFYMYGEHYGNSTGFGPSPPLLYPKLVVYTSPDMMNWDFRGFALNDWPSKPYGTFFTPWTIYNSKSHKFVMWFNAYLHGCCEGQFGVAESTDGIHFDVITLNETALYPEADSNGLFVDDDGVAYIAYTSQNPGVNLSNHRIAIERLTDDYQHFAGELVYGLFPEDYVEGPTLFKRHELYYVTFGSCCCFCRGGSGVVVYSASHLQGPWIRQPLDVNCQSQLPICGAYGDRQVGEVIISAQGIGLSVLEAVDGSQVYLWHGERWLSAPFNNPVCPDECRSTTGICKEDDRYIKGHGFSYWTPLEFDREGRVLQFQPFVASFTLSLAG